MISDHLLVYDFISQTLTMYIITTIIYTLTVLFFRLPQQIVVEARLQNNFQTFPTPTDGIIKVHRVPIHCFHLLMLLPPRPLWQPAEHKGAFYRKFVLWKLKLIMFFRDVATGKM